MVKKREIRSSNKKGQLTVLMIVGIVLLFTFAGVFYLTQVTVKETATAERDVVLEDVPQQFKPIQTYTHNCLSQIARNGLLLLGEQGGYLYPDLVGDFSEENPTNSDGLVLSSAKVPYWHYQSSLNEEGIVRLSSLQPSLKGDDELSVESQLSRFVEEKIDGCLDNYAVFENQGFSVKVADEKAVSVGITDNTVNFLLNRDVEANLGGSENSFEQFFVKIPLQLKKYYELADGITRSQVNYTFLERQGLDLIQVYSEVDDDKLPPTSGATFEFAPTVFWNVLDIKEKLQGLLNSNVPLLRLASASNSYRYEYPTSDLSNLYQKTYDNMILPIPGAEDVSVNFDYLGWEPYLEVNDRGGVVAPTSVSANYQLLHFSTQRYNTIYDLSYPVLVTIEDNQAFDGEGYKFVFALESNIRSNRPSEDNQLVANKVSSFSRSLVCNSDQADTGVLRSLVVDGYSREPLEAVQLAFQIPEQDTCLIGETDNNGKIGKKYPAVYGGILSFIKEGYLTTYVPLDTYVFKGEDAVLGELLPFVGEPAFELNRKYAVPVTVKKKNLEKCIGSSCAFSGLFSGGDEAYSYKPNLLKATHKWVFTNSVKDLEANEKAVVTFTRVDANSDPFSAVISFEGGQSEQMLELVPGIYEVTGHLTLEQALIIPKEERCSDGVLEAIACFDVEGCCFTTEEVVLDRFLSGQVSWEDEKTYLKITPEQLYTANSLEFYLPSLNLKNVPRQEHKRVIEDLQAIAELPRISQEFREELEPVFR